MESTLERAVHHFGGQSALATALGITPQAIQQWKQIPPGRALEIEELTRGKITAHEILREHQENRSAPSAEERTT